MRSATVMACAGVVAGTALQLQQATLAPAFHAVALLAASAALAWLATLRRAGAVRPIVLALAFAGAAFAVAGLRAASFAQTALAPALEGVSLTVTGVVATMPQRNEAGQRFRFDVESAHGPDGLARQLPPRIVLGWYSGGFDAGPLAPDAVALPALHAGERWQFDVKLKAPHGNANPFGFDYELWLWEQDLQATGSVRSGPRDTPPRLLSDSWLHPIERARHAVRDAVQARVADRQAAGILAALVTGDQNAIERADWDVFRATGVAHLMSISGLHITMFAWAAALLIGALWRRSARLCLAVPAQTAGTVGGVVLAAGYALFSGWGVPSQRTVCMLATVALLALPGRRWPWHAVWMLACAVVVALDPWALMQAGFWLSFVAVGVLFATDAGSAGQGHGGWRGRLLAAWHEQWVVTLALTPLTLLLFGQASVVGLLANALAIPWVTLLVTPLAMGGVAVPALWDAAALAVQALAAYLQWLAAWPYAAVSVATPPLWAAACGVAGGALLAMRLPRHLRVLGLPLLLPVALWQAPRPAAGDFDLLAADIGQGNAVVVRTAGHTLVYDTGPRFSAESDAGHRVLVPLLRAFGERVDTVMLSHRDLDHIGGAPAVLAMQPQAALVSSIEDTHPLQSLRRASRCVAGQHWEWDGVAFDVLQPQAADYDGAAKSNAMSCVLRIRNPRATALLAGDIEQPQEARLALLAAQQPGLLKADLLLVPHHGSKTSSSDAFLDAVQPSMAIVQAGYRNRFGHPAAPVMARYALRHVAVVDSPHCGAVRWRSAEPASAACERDRAPRYWQHRFPQQSP